MTPDSVWFFNFSSMICLSGLGANWARSSPRESHRPGPRPGETTPRSVGGGWFGLGPGLRRDDDSDWMVRAEVRPIDVTFSAERLRTASVILLQRQETRFHFLRTTVPSLLPPQGRGYAPFRPGDARCRTCRLCRLWGRLRRGRGPAIAPRAARPYLPSTPPRRAATPRTP